MIPGHAKEVFAGEIFTIYQWEQKMYDGSTAVFEAASRPDTATVIAITQDGKILRQRQEQPHKLRTFYSLPGGRIEPGEEALEGAKRELREETGYVSDDWELMNHYCPSGKLTWTMYTFVARNARKVYEMDLDAGEKIQNETITLDQLLEWCEQESFRHADLLPRLIRAKYHSPSRAELEQILFGR